MRRAIAVTAAVIGLSLTAPLIGVVPTGAAPDKIAFPENWKSHTLYTTVDRYDVKQYRELYASSPAAVQAMKDGQPLPYGTVLTIVQYKAQVNAQGTPIKDANGRFVKGDVAGIGVMEKRQGWGAEYPPELRNGEWEYSAFSADGTFNDKANYKGCFECHKPHEKQDFVISQAKVRTAAAAAATAAPDVTIGGFAFGPATLTVAPGKTVTWVNNDDSPHQISVTTGAPGRSPILAKGQSHSQAFSAPGVYDYMCGLHPAMKGQVEVK